MFTRCKAASSFIIYEYFLVKLILDFRTVFLNWQKIKLWTLVHICADIYEYNLLFE